MGIVEEAIHGSACQQRVAKQFSIAVPTKLQPSTVPPVVSLRIDQERKLLALEARGGAALVLAIAFGAGLLAWAAVLLMKVMK